MHAHNVLLRLVPVHFSSIIFCVHREVFKFIVYYNTVHTVRIILYTLRVVEFTQSQTLSGDPMTPILRAVGGYP